MVLLLRQPSHTLANSQNHAKLRKISHSNTHLLEKFSNYPAFFKKTPSFSSNVHKSQNIFTLAKYSRTYVMMANSETGLVALKA